MVDSSTPHPARRYNYLLGGNLHFAADRAAGDALAAFVPGVREAVRANRAVHQRMVRHLAAGEGVRQFLDVGTGLPAPDNTHEVAQAADPAVRVVYVDNDPLVTEHAGALLTGGATAYLEADMRDPAAILGSDAVRGTLDLTQPVAVLLISVLHFVRDDDEAAAIVRGLTGALPAGSFLAVTHATWDHYNAANLAQVRAMTEAAPVDAWPRTREQTLRFFDGYDLIAPGIVEPTRWRPDAGTRPYDVQNTPGWAVAGRRR
ncbi:SAM-dependent methyltransferase [Actinoplanes sp. NPDC049265]|uniref:SAM-dependent methyltransferase n=1 Tax=Actinoplanes sp. NPDC049265 TaxID=3363902 RepID=UPI003712D7ED